MKKAQTADPHPLDSLQSLLADWRISLRAGGRSLATIASYLTVGESFVAYLAAQGLSTRAGKIGRQDVEHYLADMRDRGLSPATVAKHYRSLQQLFRWLTDDGEIDRSPMERMSPPSVPEQPVPILDDAALTALLGTCKGNTFENRRDTAIIRLLLDTGMRTLRAWGRGRRLHPAGGYGARQGRPQPGLSLRFQDRGCVASLHAVPRPAQGRGFTVVLAG